jgi:hypothetical protein
MEKQGYALPEIAHEPSAAAPMARLAAIGANTGKYELQTKPRVVIDKQGLPCCVSCSLSSALETLYADYPPLSPLFHYYVTRVDNHGADANGFLFLESGLSTLLSNGICTQKLHSVPFQLPDALTKPSSDAYADALGRSLAATGARYLPIGGLSNAAAIRTELSQDHPVLIGIQLPVGYPDPRAFLNPRLEWLNPGLPRSSDGHCVLAIGYDDSRAAFHIQDNRGPNSFEGGCWWMGYRVADSSVVQEAYSLIKY